jgi:hypothetical protein
MIVMMGHDSLLMEKPAPIMKIMTISVPRSALPKVSAVRIKCG